MENQMTGTMKAAIYQNVGKIEIDEVEIPAAKPGYVLLKIKSCGICGSDLHSYFGHWGQGAKASGHEISGVVVELGEGVTEVKVGDRVCVECFSHCGKCLYCRTGAHNLCLNRASSSGGEHSGFAEYGIAHSSSLYILPEGLSFEQGVLVEPLAVSHRTLCQAQVTHRDTVLILGSGTIGLFCLAAAKAIGVRQTIISTKYEHQAQMALQLCADHVIRIKEQNLREQVKQITNNLGADVVIETIASPENFDDALSVARRKGRLVLVGGYHKPLEVNIGQVVGLEATIVGSNCYAYSGIRTDFEASINLIASGKVAAAKLVTHRFPLTEIAEAFIVAADKNSGSIKVLVNPSG